MSITIDQFNRMMPHQGRHGVLLPEEQSVSHWGIFLIPGRVELFTLDDRQDTDGNYLSIIKTSMGTIKSVTTREPSNHHDVERRLQNDVSAIAQQLGFRPNEIELLS